MNDHKNEIGNQLFNLLVQILLCSNNGGSSAASGVNGNSNHSAGGTLNVSGTSAGGSSIAGTLAGLVGASDLQQQLANAAAVAGQQQHLNNKQITGAASTANRDV